MIIGVISDVHGNILALDAVLKEFERRNVEKIICCGDIIGIGPRPEETVQRIIGLGDKIICVRGNHEGYLLDGVPDVIHDNKRQVSEKEKAFFKWTKSSVSEKSKEFLSKLPYEIETEIEGKKIYIAHYAYGENRKFKKHILEPNLEECKNLFSYVDADVYLFGHTHFKIVNGDDFKKYINPGPLGCPVIEKKANCGILEIKNGIIKYDQLGVDYDIKQVIENIKEKKYPNYIEVLTDFYGEKCENI